jgi:hypothetical protein
VKRLLGFVGTIKDIEDKFNKLNNIKNTKLTLIPNQNISTIMYEVNIGSDIFIINVLPTAVINNFMVVGTNPL